MFSFLNDESHLMFSQDKKMHQAIYTLQYVSYVFQ